MRMPGSCKACRSLETVLDRLTMSVSPSSETTAEWPKQPAGKCTGDPLHLATL